MKCRALPLLVFLGIVACGAAVCPLPAAGQAQYVGIQTAAFNYVAASQHTPMWCWATSIEMVLRYYGVDIRQEDIVAQTFGTGWGGKPPPFGASIDLITQNLNHSGVDRSGNPYNVSASVTNGALSDAAYLQELQAGSPLILAYGPNLNSGHVVVLTAASYVQTPMGPRIYTLVVRDPFPSPATIATGGRVEYLNYAPPPQGLPAPVQAVWFVRAFRG